MSHNINFFYKSPLAGPLEAFWGGPELGWYGTGVADTLRCAAELHESDCRY